MKGKGWMIGRVGERKRMYERKRVVERKRMDERKRVVEGKRVDERKDRKMVSKRKREVERTEE